MLTEQEKISIAMPIVKLLGEIQLEYTKLNLKLDKLYEDKINKYSIIIEDTKELVNSEYNRKLGDLDVLKRNVSFYGDYVSKMIGKHSNTLDYDMSIGNITSVCSAYGAQLNIYKAE